MKHPISPDEPISAETIHLLVGKRIRAARLKRGLTLAELGGNELSRSFLSLVELGRSRISLRALAIVASRLQLPLSYFVDASVPDGPSGKPATVPGPAVDHVEAALAYSQVLRTQGELERALDYALWAAQARLEAEAKAS